MISAMSFSADVNIAQAIKCVSDALRLDSDNRVKVNTHSSELFYAFKSPVRLGVTACQSAYDGFVITGFMVWLRVTDQNLMMPSLHLRYYQVHLYIRKSTQLLILCTSRTAIKCQCSGSVVRVWKWNYVLSSMHSSASGSALAPSVTDKQWTYWNIRYKVRTGLMPIHKWLVVWLIRRYSTYRTVLDN